MRSTKLLVVGLATFTPASLTAQSAFEGVITQTVTGLTGHELKTWVKGNRFRTELPGPDGATATMIGDESGRLLMVIDAEKKYYAMSGPGMRGEAAEAPPTVTATGRSETIAGFQCAYYHLHRASGTPKDEDLCVTQALGFVKAARAAGIDEPFIRRTWPKGFVVLKSLDARGAVQSEVKRIERKPVDSALLAPPAGYTELKMGRPDDDAPFTP